MLGGGERREEGGGTVNWDETTALLWEGRGGREIEEGGVVCKKEGKEGGMERCKLL